MIRLLQFNLTIAVCLLVFLTATSVESGMLFFSEVEPGSGALPGNPTVQLPLNEPTTLYLYFQPEPTDNVYNTIAVNLQADEPSSISVLSFDVQNPDVTFNGTRRGTRWNGTGGSLVDSGSLISNMSGISVTQSGLDVRNDGSGFQLDQGFDSSSSAFYFGSVTMQLEQASDVELFLSVGSSLIVRAGDTLESSAMVHFGVDDAAVSGTSHDARSEQWDLKLIYLEQILADFNDDGRVDVQDVDLLMVAIRTGSIDSEFDLDVSGATDPDDLNFLVSSILKTWRGDANLDGQFNSNDFITVFQAGEYEDAVPLNSTWAEGDWNADGEFDSGDLIAAFQDGGYEKPAQNAMAVPEPSTVALTIAALCATFGVRKSDSKSRLSLEQKS